MKATLAGDSSSRSEGSVVGVELVTGPEGPKALSTRATAARREGPHREEGEEDDQENPGTMTVEVRDDQAYWAGPTKSARFRYPMRSCSSRSEAVHGSAIVSADSPSAASSKRFR